MSIRGTVSAPQCNHARDRELLCYLPVRGATDFHAGGTDVQEQAE